MTKSRIRSSVPVRERILDAADGALARFGYRRMTIDDIARGAGIGKGTVYLSFDSKREIALACLDRMSARVRDRLSAIAEGNGPPEERLHEMLVARVMIRFDYARGHSASVDELLSALRADVLERRERHFRAEAAVLATVLREVRYAPAGLALDATTRAMVDASNALLPYSLSVREMGRRAQIERRARALARLVVRGATPEASIARRRSA